MAYNPQEDFQRIMEEASREQSALRQKNAAAAQQKDEDSKKSSGGEKGGKSSKSDKGGKSGASGDPGLAAAMKDARDNWKPGAIPTSGAAPSSGKDPVGLAASMLGKNETQHTAELMDYLRKGGRDLNPSQLAWCAGFVGSSLEQAGIKGTGSNVATSYMSWGNSVDPASGIQRNDVVVFPHGHKEGETGGHVGFATGRVENGRMEVISGNQSNQVTTTWEPINGAVIRRGDNPGAPVADTAAQHDMHYPTAASQEAGHGTSTLGADLPAGMRNNNPGNIKWFDGAAERYSGAMRPSANTDQGDPQIVFRSHEDGMKAAASLATSKYDKGYNTVDKLIAGQGGWTPGNHEAAVNIARSMGVDPHAEINLHDPKQMNSFLGGLTKQEHGTAGANFYTPDKINSMLGDNPALTTAIPSALSSQGGKIQQSGVNVPDSALGGTPYQAQTHIDAYGRPVTEFSSARQPQTADTSAMSNSATAIPLSSNGDDMAKKARGDVRPNEWKDQGAAENARNRPQQSNAPTPPDRPRTFADQRGWQDQGAAENTRNNSASPDTPLPPERPSEYTDQAVRQGIPTIDQGPGAGPASAPNPMVNVPTPPARPDNIQPAVSGPQQHANYGPPMPNIGPPQPATANVPLPPASNERPEQAVPLPPASNERPDQTGAQGVPAAQAPQAAQQSDPFTDFGNWLSSLFDNPENLNGHTETADAAPSADAGGDFDLGAGLSGIGDAVGSFFAGFQKGGPVQSFASGGLVAKNGKQGRPDRVASAQPGVAIPGADRGTSAGGGYTATIATSPGYALGGPIDSEDGEPVLGGAPAPETETQTSSEPVAVGGPIPTSGDDVAPIIGPSSVEAKQQAAMEKYAEQRRISQEMHRPRNLRELLSQTAYNVVQGVQSDYGIDKAVQRQQSQAVPGADDVDPLTAFFNMLSGAPDESASSEQVKTLGKAVDPYDRLTEGMRTTAGMAAGVEYLLNKGDYKGAQEMARSVMFHQQLQTAKWGDKAVDLLREGKKDAAIDAMVKAQQQIPDGTNIKAKSVQGGAIAQQTDSNGKVVGEFKLNDAQLMGMALGLKDGSAYWQAIVHLANGDKGEVPHSQAYEQWANRPEPTVSAPSDPNSPAYKQHEEAVRVAGPQPTLPANFGQMSKEEQDMVRKGVGEERQGWNTRYGGALTSQRQQAGFGHQDESQSRQFDHSDAAATTRYDRQVEENKRREGVADQRQLAREGRTADRNLSSGKLDKAIQSGMDAVVPDLDSSDPRYANLTSITGRLLTNNPGMPPAEAARAAIAIAKGAAPEVEGGVKLPDGSVVKYSAPARLAPPAQQSSRPAASW